MKTIQVHIKSVGLSYPIFIGENGIGSIAKLFNLESYSKVIVITDTTIEKLLLSRVMPHLPKGSPVITIPYGERAKSIECVEEIWRQLLELGCDRKSLIINVGGGVVGDVGGFAASTFMRGVDFLQIPTTLLAQVDASIGGKTGINFIGVKNLIGTFKQPIGVMCDMSMLKTLPERAFVEGFGEIIKHGIIADKEYFTLVTSKKPLDFSLKELTEIVGKSCDIKKTIIEEDTEEKDRRRLINFGHTIGHALESLSHKTDKPLLHGEAVSIGMVAEAKISVLKKMLKSEDLETIINVLKHAGLPTTYAYFKEKEAVEQIKSDKKSEKGVVYFTLIEGIGKTESGQEVTDTQILNALQFIKS